MSELALLGALTGLQTFGSIERGRAAEEEGRFRADLLEQEARRAERQGVADASAVTAEGQRQGARQRARLARAGVILAGSPVLQLGETAADAARLAREARTDATVRADLDRRRAAGALDGGRRGGFRGLLSAGETLLRAKPTFGRN